MDNYIRELCEKYNQPNPKKFQLSLNRHQEINYGAKTQYTPNVDDSTKLDDKDINCVQGIVDALLYYEIAVNTKLLVSLRKLDPNKRRPRKTQMKPSHNSPTMLPRTQMTALHINTAT